MTREEQLLIAQDLADRFADYMVKINVTLPQPKAVISLETAIAFALVYADEFATGQAAAMREQAGLDWKPIAELGTEKRCVFVTGPDDWPSVEVYNMPPFVNNQGRLVAFSQNSSNMGSMHWVTHFAEMGDGPLPATGEVGRG